MPHELRPQQGVLLLAGYGLRIAVERGHLCVDDGVGANRRSARFARPTRELRRVVVLGHSGTVSFDALRWLSDVGAGFVQIDHDGRVIAAAGPLGLQDVRLRRAQAMAAGSGAGLAIAKDLVRAKVARQWALLDRLPEAAESRAVVREARDRLGSARSIEQLRAIESEAALAYWRAWAPIEVQFARRDRARVPVHWLTFGRRSSLVTGTPRKATNPANALLNYLYAIAEAEARLAALAVGCDPGLGVMHADQKARDSLACDLMEPVRPAVDARVLDILGEHTFRRGEFFETREGVCRIMPPLTRLLAETAPAWAAAVAPVAESLVRRLLGQNGKVRSSSVPTPLTQANRSAGRDGIRVRPRRSARARPSALPSKCVVCGSELLGGRRRQYCEDCKPVQASEALSRAKDVLRARRRAGDDPAHGGCATRRRSETMAERHRLNAAWEREHPGVLDPRTFVEEIQPRLATVSLAAMVQATGLSQPYCAMIRRGEQVPHPRHWGVLASLSERAGSADTRR